MSRSDTRSAPAELADDDRELPDDAAMLEAWHRSLSELSTGWDERVAALRRELADSASEPS